ncbi:hypothetical protein BH10BAC3_BH10BAC3_24900 [soil metagenome]
MNMAGQEMGTDIHTSIASLLKIDTMPDNKYSFELTYDDYEVSQNLNGKEMDLKSLTKDTGSDNNKGMDFIKGITFKSLVTAAGKSEQMSGAEGLVSRLDQALGDMPEENRKKLIAGLTPILNSDMAKGMLEQCFYVFPAEKVNIGDSWKNEIIMRNMFSMVINSTYTLMEIKDSIAHIKVHADIRPGKPDVIMPGLAMAAPKGSDPSPKEGGLDLMGMKMKAAFSGTQDGMVWVNMKSGMVQKNELNQDLTGKISISILDLPMTMKVVTSYEVNAL